MPTQSLFLWKAGGARLPDDDPRAGRRKLAKVPAMLGRGASFARMPARFGRHVWKGHIPGTPVAAMFEKGGCLTAGISSLVSSSFHPAGATFSSGSSSPRGRHQAGLALPSEGTSQFKCDSKTHKVGRERRLLLGIL